MQVNASETWFDAQLCLRRDTWVLKFPASEQPVVMWRYFKYFKAMAQTLRPPNLIKVICIGCAKEAHYDCPICAGSRFHLWDPNTFLCYSNDGTQLFGLSDSGTSVPVTRSAHASLVKPLSIEEMLKRVERWVLASPVRKWRLTMDEDGWHACVWFNHYKKHCFDTSDPTLAPCIERCYLEIQKEVTELVAT